MKILTIKDNPDIGLNAKDIYDRIVGGFKRMNLDVSKWCESITLEDIDDK